MSSPTDTFSISASNRAEDASPKASSEKKKEIKRATMFGCLGYLTKLFLVLCLSARVDSEVKERHCFYSCSDLQLTFDPKCDHLWTINNSDFARSDPVACQHPCEWIKAGVMKLKDCVAVNSSMFCFSEVVGGKGGVREERIYYSAQPRSAAPPVGQTQGVPWLMLLLLLLLLWSPV